MLRSSIGKKAIVGITGLALVGFVIAHLLGNLLIFGGPEALNAYAAKLRHLGALLWVARIGLLLTAAVHIVLAIQLAVENRAARPVGYAARASIQVSPAAKTMAVSGSLLLAFIIYHLLHFTFQATHPHLSHFVDAKGRHDVYMMVVLSFQDPRLVGAYVAAMGLLCLHLSHGIASFCQSLGFHDPRLMPGIQRASRTLAALIFIGYSAIPLSIVFGLIRSTRWP